MTSAKGRRVSSSNRDDYSDQPRTGRTSSSALTKPSDFLVDQIEDFSGPISFSAADYIDFRRSHPEYTEFPVVAHMFMKARLKLHPPPPLSTDIVQSLKKATDNLTEQYHKVWPVRKQNARTQIMFEVASLRRDLFFYTSFPVNNLPSEVLSNIFYYAIWSATSTPIGIQIRYNLSAVCRHWRQLIVNDPTIWSAIGIHGHKDIPRAIQWCERAGGAMIDMRIDEQDAYGKGVRHHFEPKHMEELLDVIFTKLHQIRGLCIVIQEWPALLVFLDRLRLAGQRGTPINLARIEIQRSGHPFVWIGPGFEPDSHRQPIPLFGGAPAPSLRHLTLSGVSIDWEASKLRALRVLELTCIALDSCPSLRVFRDMLDSCPNLTRLSLNCAGPSSSLDMGVKSRHPIKLLRLGDLALSGFSLHYALFLSEQFDAPHVRRLTLANFKEGDYAPLFRTWTGRYPEVQYLTVANVDIPQDNIPLMAKWLDSMPNITFLRTGYVPGSFLESFLRDREDPDVRLFPTAKVVSQKVISPKLATLEIDGLPVSQLLFWMDMRTRIGAPFRRVYLLEKFASAFQPTEAQQLRSLGDICVIRGGTPSPEENRFMALIC